MLVVRSEIFDVSDCVGGRPKPNRLIIGVGGGVTLLRTLTG